MLKEEDVFIYNFFRQQTIICIRSDYLGYKGTLFNHGLIKYNHTLNPFIRHLVRWTNDFVQASLNGLITLFF